MCTDSHSLPFARGLARNRGGSVPGSPHRAPNRHSWEGTVPCEYSLSLDTVQDGKPRVHSAYGLAKEPGNQRPLRVMGTPGQLSPVSS